jgi:acyl-CoA reductase-like NAD-dependent aldehyde dehydrogenase
LPQGVLNSLCESGSEASEALVGSPGVDVISFTGSSAVGKRIMAAAAGTLKRLNLELGGKAPGIVFEDCDPEAIAPKLAASGMILSGQQCTAMNRVLVHESRFEAVKKALAAALAAMKVGSSLQGGNAIGPLIDTRNRDRIRDLVAAHADAAVLAGKTPDELPKKGAFVAPSLLGVTELGSAAIQEEFFGPVMNIESFTDEDDAVVRANATRYGLSASVWTHDLDRAHRVARRLRSGTVWLNDHNKLIPEAETGGVRESGYGRLHGMDGMSEFLSSKHVYHRFGPGH